MRLRQPLLHPINNLIGVVLDHSWDGNRTDRHHFRLLVWHSSSWSRRHYSSILAPSVSASGYRGVMELELVYARYNGASAGRSSGELSPTEFPVLFLLYLDGSTGRLVKRGRGASC